LRHDSEILAFELIRRLQRRHFIVDFLPIRASVFLSSHRFTRAIKEIACNFAGLLSGPFLAILRAELL
jgi:hypothetical protein